MESVIYYKTSSPAGDAISFLAGIRQMWKETGQKAVIYQALNVVGVGIQGVNQPFKNENDESILMGKEMFDNLKPLIEAQEYVDQYLEYKGEKVDIDFDKIRNEIFVNQPLGSLNRYPFYAFPQMNCDLSEAWLLKREWDSTNYHKDRIYINFTFRYRNNFINYFFLKKYEAQVYFLGLENEYDFFCKQWGLNIYHFKSIDFFDISYLLSRCKFFMGNASVIFQIAEALKAPRILETFQLIPNVIPVGKDAYDFYHQSSCEYYFNKLINKKI